MFFERDNCGANPVVATILIVGIVVILSASIGTFVLQLGTDLDKGSSAAVDITDLHNNAEDGYATISLIALDRAEYITTTVTSTSGNRLENATSKTATIVETDLTEPGDSVTIREGNFAGGQADTTIRIIVTASNGNRKSIVLDREVTI